VGGGADSAAAELGGEQAGVGEQSVS
jgi:hypothetical protein